MARWFFPFHRRLVFLELSLLRRSFSKLYERSHGRAVQGSRQHWGQACDLCDSQADPAECLRDCENRNKSQA